eukprot:GSChrysophyteH1.ASY1.ANO1.384.1 assembled CDS
MKVAVITGASRGIGLELVKKYLALGGYEVLACCRSNPGELSALGCTVVSGVDVTEKAGLNTLTSAVGERTVDLLINNAGILHVDGIDSVLDNIDEIKKQFDTNAIAPLVVTAALRPNLTEGSRVAIIGSRMGSVSDNGSGSYYGYRMSKAAVNQATKSLSVDLAPAGIIVQVFHPGYVDTDMTARTQSDQKISTHTSAEGLVRGLEAMSMASSGSFHSFNGDEIGW